LRSEDIFFWGLFSESGVEASFIDKYDDPGGGTPDLVSDLCSIPQDSTIRAGNSFLEIFRAICLFLWDNSCTLSSKKYISIGHVKSRWRYGFILHSVLSRVRQTSHLGKIVFDLEGPHFTTRLSHKHGKNLSYSITGCAHVMAKVITIR